MLCLVVIGLLFFGVASVVDIREDIFFAAAGGIGKGICSAEAVGIREDIFSAAVAGKGFIAWYYEV